MGQKETTSYTGLDGFESSVLALELICSLFHLITLLSCQLIIGNTVKKQKWTRFLPLGSFCSSGGKK